MTTVNNVNLDNVIKAVFKAVNNLPYIKGKWWAEYISHEGCVSLASIKSGMCVTFPINIKITDSDVVELRSDENDWAFFRHIPEEGCLMSDEMLDTLASVLEDELTSFISGYWARK